MTKVKVPRGSYVFYESFARIFSALTPEDELSVRCAIDAYAFGWDVPELSPIASAIFDGILPQVESSRKGS